MSAELSEAKRLARSAGLAFFGAGYLVSYFVSTSVPTPLLWYYPLERRFGFSVRSTGLAMDFYGRFLLAFAVGGVALLVARAVLARASAATCARALRLGTVWSAVLLVFTAGLYVYLLWARTPFPMQLPAGYVPR
jgi:hypothetical protein